MSLIEHELAKLPTARLRELAHHQLPHLAEAARAELADRPATLAEELRAALFPPNPNR